MYTHVMNLFILVTIYVIYFWSTWHFVVVSVRLAYAYIPVLNENFNKQHKNVIKKKKNIYIVA